MKCEDIKREVKVGDTIVCKGQRVEVAEIISQDCYKDENCRFFGVADGSYIYLEFRDKSGRYRYWKSSVDGGYVIYCD